MTGGATRGLQLMTVARAARVTVARVPRVAPKPLVIIRAPTGQKDNLQKLV
jgi:hypothetical protein